MELLRLIPIILTIPDYQVVPLIVSTFHQDTIVVSCDPLPHWVSDVKEGIPVIVITIITIQSLFTFINSSTSDFNDSIC